MSGAPLFLLALQAAAAPSSGWKSFPDGSRYGPADLPVSGRVRM